MERPKAPSQMFDRALNTPLNVCYKFPEIFGTVIFQTLLPLIRPCQIFMMEFLAKITIFCKKFHYRLLTGPLTHLWLYRAAPDLSYFQNVFFTIQDIFYRITKILYSFIQVIYITVYYRNFRTPDFLFSSHTAQLG